jgi:RNA polymerase sigma factor (TIGR02999 family)
MSEVTVLLEAASCGDSQAQQQLLPLIYVELRRLAAAKMALETPGQTLQPTALVHEAWLRLAGKGDRKWNDRTHFFAAASEAMRRILVDNARRKLALRHGGSHHRVEMPEIAMASATISDQVVAVNDALEKFARLEPQKAELVKLRYFVGMKTDEAAELLGVSVATASRYWTYARAWLADEIRSQRR